MDNVTAQLVGLALTVVLVVLAGVVGTLAAREARAWYPVARAYVVAHVGESNLQSLTRLVEAGVHYAETQGYLAEAAQVALDKKAVAFQWVDNALKQRGIRVTADELSGLIEDAWWNEWGRDKQYEKKVQAAVATINQPEAKGSALEDAPAQCAGCPGANCPECGLRHTP